MQPVNKIRARAEALEVLGLGQTATADEIRKAWRDIAFHAHPDHTDGDYSGFSRAKTAYDFLRKEGLAHKGPSGSAAPRRPRLKRRIIDLGADEIAACRDLLSPDRALSHMQNAIPADERNQDASDHVPDAIGCFGRNLTYFVPTPVCEGANRVALPTSVLASSRRAEAEIVTFQSKSAGPGEIVIPDPIRERKFPGAKSVRIRFEADQTIRDEFGLAG